MPISAILIHHVSLEGIPMVKHKFIVAPNNRFKARISLVEFRSLDVTFSNFRANNYNF